MSRILCLNNGYPTVANPQYTTYVHTIVECLRKAGHEVDLCVIEYNTRISPIYKIWKYLIYWMQILCAGLSKYDIIYVNHLPYAWTIILNRMLRRKTVYVHWHGEELVSQSWFIRHMLAFMRSRISGFKHIVPSYYFKQKLIDIMGVSADCIDVSPSGGVDTSLFRPLENGKKGDNRIVVGFSSALTKGKGADVLLELMRMQADIEQISGRKIAFKVIDYGREAGYYTEQFRKVTTDVEVVSKMPKVQMPNFYNSLSLLLLASVRESLGLVVLEAMSCNRPVITYDLCAFPEFVVPGESGELAHYDVAIEDRVDAIKNALIKVIMNYDMYHPRDIVLKKYSEEAVVEFYKTIQ